MLHDAKCMTPPEGDTANFSMLFIRCLKAAEKCLTLHMYMYQLRKYFIKNVEKDFWGCPKYWPWEGHSV